MAELMLLGDQADRWADEAESRIEAHTQWQIGSGRFCGHRVHAVPAPKPPPPDPAPRPRVPDSRWAAFNWKGEVVHGPFRTKSETMAQFENMAYFRFQDVADGVYSVRYDMIDHRRDALYVMKFGTVRRLAASRKNLTK